MAGDTGVGKSAVLEVSFLWSLTAMHFNFGKVWKYRGGSGGGGRGGVYMLTFCICNVTLCIACCWSVHCTLNLKS